MGVGYGVTAALDMFSSDSLLDDFAQKQPGKPDSPTSDSPPSSPIDTQNQKPEDHTPPAAGSHSHQLAEAMIERFDRVEERLTRLETCVEASMVPVGHAPSHDLASHELASLGLTSDDFERDSARSLENFVTRAELSAAMEQFSNTLDTDIQRRFDIQNRSVQSLRTMVARTDELLEQVLETIESAAIPA